MRGEAGTAVKTAGSTAVEERLEDLYEVVLYNDDTNTMDHVVKSLMRVFAHSRQLAEKIMIEAHEKGKAAAEVEAESPAKRHKAQLLGLGLTAAVVKVGCA